MDLRKVFCNGGTVEDPNEVCQSAGLYLSKASRQGFEGGQLS